MNAARRSEYHGAGAMNGMMRRGFHGMGVEVALALLVLGIWLPSGCGALTTDFAPAGQDEAQQDTGHISEIAVDDLSPEARATLQLIEVGGPFPYSKDGSVFHNYEGLLPARGDGYYREFTVPTPGSADRGARRIVAGEAGEKYYTDDHYASFKLVVG